jgi:hypothetical protein
MLPTLETLLYWTLLTFWGVVGFWLLLLAGGAVFLAAVLGLDALSRALHCCADWCARWLYPEYTIPLGLALSPVVCVAWALLR